jgi:hypothetical protein
MDNVLSVWISAPLESVNHLLAKLNTAYKFCSKVYLCVWFGYVQMLHNWNNITPPSLEAENWLF